MFDFTLFGLHFSWATTGQWWKKTGWGISWGKEYFHNGKHFIPGFSITLASIDLCLSLEKHWHEYSRLRIL